MGEKKRKIKHLGILLDEDKNKKTTSIAAFIQYKDISFSQARKLI